MIKSFQSNAPAKVNLFSAREAVSLGPALIKVPSATDYEIDRSEADYLKGFTGNPRGP